MVSHSKPDYRPDGSSFEWARRRRRRGSAFPSYAQGYYRRSNAFYRSWDAVSRERQTFQAWLERDVMRAGPEAFAVHATRVA
jgi:hypothetical protein